MQNFADNLQFFFQLLLFALIIVYNRDSQGYPSFFAFFLSYLKMLRLSTLSFYTFIPVFLFLSLFFLLQKLPRGSTEGHTPETAAH